MGYARLAKSMSSGYSFILGTDNFRELVSNDELNVDQNKLFVDKSLFIKEFIDSNIKVLLITRPRSWGKSLILSMLQHFFSKEVNGIPTDNLFKGLKISKYLAENSMYKSYQGQYPVILVSFKDLHGLDYSATEDRVKDIIAELYRQHMYLLKSDVLDKVYKLEFNKILNKEESYGELINSIKLLSEVLYKHHGKKVYVLIDEYDSILNDSLNKPKLLGKVTIFLNNLYGACLKSNNYLEKGLVTGVLRIISGNIFYGLNNLGEYTVLDDQFSEYYGFTRIEVKELLDKINIKKDDEIRSLYNGYNVGNSAIYNPWSTMQYLERGGELSPYWIRFSDPWIIKDLLINKSSVELKLKILELVKNRTAKLKLGIQSQTSLGQINADLEYLWSVLVHAGYFTMAGSSTTHHIKLPHEEISQLINEYIQEWFALNPILDIAAKNLLDGDFLAFEQDLKEILIFEDAKSYLTNQSMLSYYIHHNSITDGKYFKFKEFLCQFLIMIEIREIAINKSNIYEIAIESQDIAIYKKILNFTVINHGKKLYIASRLSEHTDLEDLKLIDKERFLGKININNIDAKFHDYEIIRLGIVVHGIEFRIVA